LVFEWFEYDASDVFVHDRGVDVGDFGPLAYAVDHEGIEGIGAAIPRSRLHGPRRVIRH
jgi:hypothetical protein